MRSIRTLVAKRWEVRWTYCAVCENHTDCDFGHQRRKRFYSKGAALEWMQAHWYNGADLFDVKQTPEVMIG